MTEPPDAADEARALSAASDLAAACAALMGSRLVAAILHGSLVLGDYRLTSDIDLLVVVEDRLSDDDLDGLQRLVDDHVAEDRIDFRVVTRATAAVPTTSPAIEFYFGRHAPGELELLRRGEERDLLAEFSMVRAFGRSLIGAQPRSLFAQVPDEWIDSYGNEILTRWEQLTDDTEHAELMVLTSCRIWRYGVERVYCSKLEAAKWGLNRAPHLAAIALALQQQDTQTAVHIAPEEIGDLLAHVRRELHP